MSKRNARRRDCGYGTVELAASCFALAIMVMLSVDVAVLLLGDQVLESAVRDAAHAAGLASDAVSARGAARAALALHQTDGFVVSQPELLDGDFRFQDYSGTPAGRVIPAGNADAGALAQEAFVKVGAKLKVRLPAPISVLGLQFGGQWADGLVIFSKTHVYPIVRQNLNPQFQ